MQIDLETVLWLLLIFGIPLVIGFVFYFCPTFIVRTQASFYKKVYKDVQHLSDTDVDQGFQLPQDRWLIDKRSEFIRDARVSPEQFQGLISIYRAIGLVLFVMVGIAGGLLLFAFLRGALQ